MYCRNVGEFAVVAVPYDIKLGIVAPPQVETLQTSTTYQASLLLNERIETLQDTGWHDTMV